MARPMPRLFLVRHGETEWSQNGRHTGFTDIPLTPRGEEQVKKIAHRLVGDGLVVEPKNLCSIFVSPRQRAHRTFHLLFEHTGIVPDHVLTEEVQEWNYGKYEGLKSSEIKAIDPNWSIWKDGCPGGESAEQMQQRVDSVIQKVRDYHRRYKEEGTNTRDFMIVAHGHFSRVFISRWFGFPLCLGTHFNVEPGSVAILGYNHNSLDEPALHALNLFAVQKLEVKGATLFSPPVERLAPSKSVFAGRTTTMQYAGGRTNLQYQPISASDSIKLAGDRDNVDDIQIEDLNRPTTHEGRDMPDDQVAPGSGPTFAVKKKLVSSATAKTNEMSPKPTAKKALNPGTSGSASTKPSGLKVTPGAAFKSSAPVLKKSTTSPPAVASRPALSSSTSSKPNFAATPATRRMSVVPAKTVAPAMAKLSLSASASTKPSEELRGSPTGSVGSARSPTVTPAPGRPRPSVSEAVKKPQPTSRPSIASFAKPAGPSKTTTVVRSSATPTTKSSRPAGSISSIKEVGTKEAAARADQIIELRGQLEKANKSLESKTGVVADLEGKIIQLEESLVSANAEVHSKASTVSNLEEVKVVADSLLSAAQDALKQAQEELAEVNSKLESAAKELSAARINALAKDEAIQSLQTQKKDLEAVVASNEEKMTMLEANHVKAVATMTEAASVEREDHLKVQAELKSRVEDIEVQKGAHAEVVKELEARSAKLKELTEAGEALQARLATLLGEKEETANKVSELEVEILELKETQEVLGDNRDSLQTRVDELLGKLADADVAARVAADAARKKDNEHSEKLMELSVKHQLELEASAARVVEITASLDKLRAEYDNVAGDLEKTKKDVINKEEQHSAKLDEVEKVHTDALAALSSQLEQVTRRLNEQESIYNKKVNELDAEHAKLLEKAFERAKGEAAHVHGLELHELRSKSNLAIQQIQEANQNSLEELKAEHASTLETEVGSLNKHISNLNLELKATQDDLAKAKTSLETWRGEMELLTQQRDDARAQADAAPTINPEQTAEILRLGKELEGIKDDLAQRTNTLTLTKSSMEELSDKHVKELEAVAKGRADEVLQLRAAHDAEVSDLATQKAELLVKLADLEGELVTVKTTLAAHEATLPKVNGVSRPSSPGVPREELQKLHEAHNLKIHDMQADHDKALKSAKEELESAFNRINDLQQDIARKDMEIQFLGQDQEENQEHITRLKADLESVTVSQNPQPDL